MIKREDNCPKCGWKSTFHDKWEVSYVEECDPEKNKLHAFCTWADEAIAEHLHVTCPACGFKDCAPCADYDEVRGASWSTGMSEAIPVATTPATSHTTSSPVVYTPPPVYSRTLGVAPTQVSTGWDSGICPECPVEK